MFSYEFCEIYKNTFFTEHLWMTASADLQIRMQILIFCMARSNRLEIFYKFFSSVSLIIKFHPGGLREIESDPGIFL